MKGEKAADTYTGVNSCLDPRSTSSLTGNSVGQSDKRGPSLSRRTDIGARGPIADSRPGE
jgi:hypothetical protein